MFARDTLATTKQQAGQTLYDFLQTFRTLRKDCNFQAVTEEDCRQQMIRDAFINGLASIAIRQCLLENRNQTLDQAYDQANALHCALRHSLAYDGTSDANVVAVAPKSLSKASNKTSHHSAKALFLQFRVIRRPKTTKVVLLLWKSFKSSKKIVRNGMETLFVLIVERRVTFRRLVRVKRKQIHRLRFSINQYV